MNQARENHALFSSIAVIFILSLLFSMSASAEVSGGKVTIRVADRPIVSFLPLRIAQDEGFFEAENVRVELKMFNNPTDAIAALVANEVDLTAANDEATLNLILRGLDIKAIFPQNVVKMGGKNQAISVRKELYDKGLRDPKDLKGKSIAWVAGWTLMPYAANKTMEKRGINMTKDMNISNIRENPAKVAALEKGAIDAALFTEPWVTIATSRGIGVPLVYLDTPEGLPTSMIAFKGDFLKANREGVLRFMKAYLKAVDVYEKAQQDPVQRRKMAEKYAKLYGLQTEDMVKMHWAEASRDGKFDTQAVQEWMDWVSAGGLVKGKVKVEQWYDPSFTEELRKRGTIK